MAQSLVFLCTLILTTQSYILPTTEEFDNDKKLDWNSAETHCLSKYNTHLLSIHDANTFQQLQKTIKDIDQAIHHFWIGLVNTATNNNEISYQWSDSSPFNFGTNIHSGTFPWFDERPESPTKDKYVRLWGGSASLLWDDTNPNKTYFWICNSNKTETYNNNIIPINDNANNNQTVNNNNIASLDTFWTLLLIAVLTLSLCILLLRLRTIYKKYKKKRRKTTSIDISSREISDMSLVESSKRKSRTTTIFVDHRDDCDSMDKCRRILISPHSNSQSLSIPQIPQISSNKNGINLEIEHDINTIDSDKIDDIAATFNCNMSVAATYDMNTYKFKNINHINDSDNGDEYMSSDTFSDKTSNYSVINNGQQSFYSTIAAFDIKSFKMKADEFKFTDIYMENINVSTNYVNEIMPHIRDDEFVVTGETSDSYDSETTTYSTKSVENKNANYDIDKVNIKRQLTCEQSHKSQKSQLSEKGMEIKANISQIMQNLKRMKTLSQNDNDESY